MMAAKADPINRSTRSGAAFFRILLAGSALLLLCARPAAAEIYRWVDEQGTIHFTDELSNIPPGARKSATKEIHEGPGTGGSLSVLSASPFSSEGDAGGNASLPSPDTSDSGSSRDILLSRIEQLKAKISAKERHIQAVDRKQSMAVNPLRNRYVAEPDLDLYRKYQEELPADREELRALEEELSSLR
jgi:Domain of unknown function (DUF4124)